MENTQTRFEAFLESYDFTIADLKVNAAYYDDFFDNEQLRWKSSAELLKDYALRNASMFRK